MAKWRKRATVEDLKTGLKAPHPTTLSEAEEAMTKLPEKANEYQKVWQPLMETWKRHDGDMATQ